jgi:hypothetical protein
MIACAAGAVTLFAGTAVAAVSALDQLNGIPCDSGAGTTQPNYGSGGAVSITCVTPTPTTPPSQTTAHPDNLANDPVNLGSVTCGDSVTATGDNLSGTFAWYTITFNNNCTMQFSLSGNTGDAMNIGLNAANTIVTDVQSYAVGTSDTYYVNVTGGTLGEEFTLTISAP